MVDSCAPPPALQLAASEGDLSLVRALVDRGVNIAVKGDNDLDHKVNYLNRLLQAEHMARRL
jgi:hypothetical protein